MSKQRRGQWFKYADTFRELMQACFNVMQQMEQEDERVKYKSDLWCVNDGYFARLHCRLIAEWSNLTDLDALRFPFSDAFVKETWIAARKDSNVNSYRRWAFNQSETIDTESDLFTEDAA